MRYPESDLRMVHGPSPVMSFQRTTYDKARHAIAAGDMAQLAALIRKPVSPTERNRLTWLRQLTHEAAAAGRGDMVDHLLALSPVNTSVGPAPVSAWVIAAEAQQDTLATHLLQRLVQGEEAHPADPAGNGGGMRQRLTSAVDLSAWHVVRLLLDEGPPPAMGQVLFALRKLAGARTEVHHPDAPALLRRLLPLAPSSGLGWALMVALRCGDEASIETCLARAERKDLLNTSTELLESALQADRYDLYVRVTTLAGVPRPSVDWAESILDRALMSDRLAFVEDALNDRPDTVEHLRHHDSAAVNLARNLVWRAEGAPNDTPEAQRRARIFPLLCSEDQSQAVKTDFELRYNTPGSAAGRRSCLNTLAQWVTPAARERWFQEDPETFAPSIARFREQDTLNATVALAAGDTAVRKPRVRV